MEPPIDDSEVNPGDALAESKLFDDPSTGFAVVAVRQSFPQRFADFDVANHSDVSDPVVYATFRMIDHRSSHLVNNEAIM